MNDERVRKPDQRAEEGTNVHEIVETFGRDWPGEIEARALARLHPEGFIISGTDLHQLVALARNKGTAPTEASSERIGLDVHDTPGGNHLVVEHFAAPKRDFAAEYLADVECVLASMCDALGLNPRRWDEIRTALPRIRQLATDYGILPGTPPTGQAPFSEEG